MVVKLLIMGLATAGTDVMELTLMLLIMGQKKEEKDYVEVYLQSAEFDVHKEEGSKI